MEVRGLPLGVPDGGTVGAMDVFGSGGEIPGGIQRDEPVPPTAPHVFQHARLLEGAAQIIKETEEVVRFDLVQRLADVVIRGDALDLEKGAGVVATAGLLHLLLETQERGALGEEDRAG